MSCSGIYLSYLDPRSAFCVGVRWSEGEQRLLSQSMPLWDIDYFRLVNFKKHQTWKKLWNQVEVTLCKSTFTFMRDISICKGAFLTVLGLLSLWMERKGRTYICIIILTLFTVFFLVSSLNWLSTPTSFVFSWKEVLKVMASTILAS